MAIEKRTRRVHRFIEIREHRCGWCGHWFETKMSHARYCPQPLTCRMQAHQDGK